MSNKAEDRSESQAQAEQPHEFASKLVEILNKASHYDHPLVGEASHLIINLLALIEQGSGTDPSDDRFQVTIDQLDDLMRNRAGFYDKTSIIWWPFSDKPSAILEFRTTEREKLGHDVADWLGNAYKLLYNWISRGCDPSIGICEYCRNLFARSRSHPTQKYCSESHRQLAYRKRKDRP